MVTIDKIKEVRSRSGVSLGKCKKALVEAHGNVEDALIVLKKLGLLNAEKKRGRETNEGKIYPYIHSDGKMGVLVEVTCETDFSARSEVFNKFCENVVLQIAAMAPKYLTSGDISEVDDTRKRDIFQAQVPKNAPEGRVPHILNGKMKKWYSEVCLMDQKSVVASKKTVEELRADLVMQIGENVLVKRFVRWEVGE